MDAPPLPAPHPAGAYFGRRPGHDRLRGFILKALRPGGQPGLARRDDGFVRRLATAGWIPVSATPPLRPRDTIKAAPCKACSAPAGSRAALLADAHGFHLASTGLDHPGKPKPWPPCRPMGQPAQPPPAGPINQNLRLYGRRLVDPRRRRPQPDRLLAGSRGQPPFRAHLAGVPHLNQPPNWWIWSGYSTSAGPLAGVLPPRADSTVTADTATQAPAQK